MSSDWNAALYDARHGFVTSYGEDLLPLLNVGAGDRVLDVGCGTGHLTAEISALGTEVVGLDSSPNMIETARKTYPNLTWELGDITKFEAEAQFDAIFSNAALHWVSEADKAVERMAKCLRPGGQFVIEMGGKGNIELVINALKETLAHMGKGTLSHTWFYPSIAEYASLLEKHGIVASSCWHFERPTALDGPDGIINWYRQFRKGFLIELSDEEMEDAFSSAQESLRDVLYDGETWFADYKRLRIVARKQFS